MFKSKKSLFILGALIAVVSLAIGFATATQTLRVNGTANALPNNSFDVYFTNAAAGTASGGASSTATLGTGDKPKIANMTVDLTALNETQTCTFTVKNGSETGVGAQFTSSNIKICTSGSYSADTGTCTAYTSSYFEITKNTSALTARTLSAGSSETFTVTVKLIKVNATATNISETFEVVLGNITPVQE